MTLLRYVHLSTADGTAPNCASCLVLKIILAASTTISLVVDNELDANAWSLICPHSMTFFHPIPAFEQDVSYPLWFMATLILVCIGLMDGVKAGP
ncbi:uncharacterized protein N7473_011157 [Penicillium subrubescens]|uniref:uncharacterized protein n=1 Tax=Penicillium subrubescens TaxID=1316194 RepID=UPI0025459DCB|nr:uncharacterized protein N7473_011157 [Penicillium subrubescens]KAJ5882723.1 hypothetical protein N7473_011157 [Penicillium subrubescens]